MIWPKAILLDFFGTVVVDDDQFILEISEQVAHAAEVPTSAIDVARFWSLRFVAACRESQGPGFLLQRDLEMGSLKDTLTRYRAYLDARVLCEPIYRHWRRPPIYPEAREALQCCPVPVCLVSNTDNAELTSALRINGLVFEHIVTSQNCRSYKPNPEPFRGALQLLRLMPGDVLHVGDSLGSDVRGAQALGIPVMWINRHGHALPTGTIPPEYIASDLTGLLRVFDRKR